MPVNNNGEVWIRSRLTTGVECASTKEFFSTQSELDSRITEYTSSIWKPRHDHNAAATSWEKARLAETKALDIIKDKFHPELIRHILNKAHKSALPLKDLIEVISKNCANFIKGEEVSMENGDDIILSCKVVKVHSDDSSYTINDGTRDIIRVPSAHLRRPHSLELFDIESLIKLACAQSKKEGLWEVDEIYKKEFGMKDKLAPIFCKPQNGSKKEIGSSEDDDVIALPPVKKAKRESNDSLKENGMKKEGKKEEKEKKPRKRKEDNEEKKEKVEKKKPKQESKVETINLDSTDDEMPLSSLAEKMKKKNQKQGFLDKFLTASPSSSKGSPSKKKQKGKVEKAIEPLVRLYKGDDCRLFVQECDTVIKGLTKEMIDGRMENLIEIMENNGKTIEHEILEVLQWRKAGHLMNTQVSKAAKEERVGIRETNRKELDAMYGKIVVEKMKERIKSAKIMKEMEEEERGEDYDKEMGKLPPSGDIIISPHFPIALMISEFIFTRGSLFPSNYKLPLTDEIVEALSAEGNEKIILSKKITYPIVNILMHLILTDEKFENRYYFCDCSLTKLKWDENSIVEMIRVLMIGEKPSTKFERDVIRDEKKGVKEEIVKKKKDHSDSSDESEDEIENEDEEEEDNGDITMNEGDRVGLVAELDGCNGKWERIEGRSQGMIMEFLVNCFLDSNSLRNIKTDEELHEDNDGLKKEKKELRTKVEDTNRELKELKSMMEHKKSNNLRVSRAETAKLYELEETLNKSEKRMEDISTHLKSVEKGLDEAKFVMRLDPIGFDRHGRRYMLMPHYGGLLIQSIGSREWIEEDDGSEYFGFIPFDEEWRVITNVKEWDELSDQLRNGSKNEKKLAKGMEKNKEKFEKGLEWREKVKENREKEKENELMNEEDKEELSYMELLGKEMSSLLEKAENGELLKVKDISLLNRKAQQADTIHKWKELLLEFEDKLRTRAIENKEFLKVVKMSDDTQCKFTLIIYRKRVEEARPSEILMLMRVLDYRIVWNIRDIEREKEAKKKEAEEEKKRNEERMNDDEDEWNDYGVHTRSNMETKDKKEGRELLKKVMKLASGRLASTLNTLESEDERLMNMKDIEEQCHRYSVERLKTILRKNLDRWRNEIECRFIHRLEQFDEFSLSVMKLLK
ncbi:hypothetical protein PRIPAC_80570 [Pristionchus pacificus]|uniref:Uncharacterized protein n=1 Tax=Pristionchus pacificus TaxID=54126 RepID=A0A2A6BYX5_PRIPA|nr:hypothetical protein PRIPAC_80570 [Pristionchus pacificus]|eukprot:PDM71069.1 hypothetical protein PRIPAC_44465 [Pristionchus pacificus]